MLQIAILVASWIALPLFVIWLVVRYSQPRTIAETWSNYPVRRAQTLDYLESFRCPSKHFFSIEYKVADGVYTSRVYTLEQILLEVSVDSLVGRDFVNDTAKHLERVRNYRGTPSPA